MPPKVHAAKTSAVAVFSIPNKTFAIGADLASSNCFRRKRDERRPDPSAGKSLAFREAKRT
jgi:hypothetical protein